MSTEMLIPGSAGALAELPDYALAEEGQTNLLGDMGGASFPRLTFKGNRFRIMVGEQETLLKGTELNTILLDAYPSVSRIYFRGTYGDDSADARPLCASADGEVPLPSVAQPPAAKCAICPMNQKGSAISDDGGKRRACSYFKRIAVFLPDHPEHGALVADLKSMSLFGDSYADKGLWNLRAYGELLAKHRTKPEAVITELSFDSNQSVPKVLFRAVGYVDKETYMEVVQPLKESGAVEALVDCTQIRTGGTDEAAPAAGGFRDKLLEGSKPEHADEDEEQEEAPPAAAAKSVTKKTTRKKATKKVPAKKEDSPLAKKPEPKPEPEAKPSHPKFCQECGSKWGTCEHTGAAEAADETDEGEEEELSAFDEDMAAALAEYDEE